MESASPSRSPVKSVSFEQPILSSPNPRISRNRREIDRYGLDLSSTSKSAVKKTSGSGVSLGSIDSTNVRITKLEADTDTLKRLHFVVYGSIGKASTRKKELRLWNGSDDILTRDSIKRFLSLTRSLSLLKDIAGVLGLEKSKDRPALEAALADYLFAPSAKVSSRGVTKTKKNNKSKKPTITKKSITKTDDVSSASSSSSSSSEDEPRAAAVGAQTEEEGEE